MAVTILVTVDTEEEYDWAGGASPLNRSVSHIRHLPRLQDVFDEFGVRPTYVVDDPVVRTGPSADVLSKLLARGSCEIGAHLHPWVSPPIVEPIEPRNTYLCNLPLGLQQEKVGRLTEAIQGVFGLGPRTFKAGRYGIDFALVPFLRSLGYRADTSVMAYWDFSEDQGPCFSEFGHAPFVVDVEHPLDDNSELPFLEVPCTVGFSRQPFAPWARIHRVLSHRFVRRFRLVGLLWHLRILRKIVLSPECSSEEGLATLLNRLGEERNPLLHVTLHSPSIEPGHTPYVRDAEGLAGFVKRLRTTLHLAVNCLAARCMTVSEYVQSFSQELIR